MQMLEGKSTLRVQMEEALLSVVSAAPQNGSTFPSHLIEKHWSPLKVVVSAGPPTSESDERSPTHTLDATESTPNCHLANFCAIVLLWAPASEYSHPNPSVGGLRGIFPSGAKQFILEDL